MNKLLFLLILVIGLASCKKKPNPLQIQSFSVEQTKQHLNFSFSSEGPFTYHEISYLPAGSDDPSTGTILTTANPASYSEQLQNTSITTGSNYLFYIRSIGEDNLKSDWFGPRALDISEYCAEPFEIEFNATGLTWGTDFDISFYEIEYGPQGFTQGTGLTTQASFSFSTDLILEANVIYDAYVRSYCDANSDWSAWVGPTSGFVSQNRNLCVDPTNLGFTTVYDSSNNPTGANMTWDDDGNNFSYEYNLVLDGELPESSVYESGTTLENTYSNLIANTQYDFYVRTVCQDGSKTAWIGPLDVVIN